MRSNKNIALPETVEIQEWIDGEKDRTKKKKRCRHNDHGNIGKQKEKRVSAHGWACVRLIDERTGNCCFGFDFPTNLGGHGLAVVDSDVAESLPRVRVQLKKRGAAFRGSKKHQIRLIAKLLQEAPSRPRILAMKPGWRDQGFILGRQLIGSAKKQYRWPGDLRSPDLGDKRGTMKAWHRDVGRAALRSSYLTFCICAELGALLPGYFRMHMKTSPTLKPLVSEPAVYNLSGDSSTGKTTATRAAAGLSGPPDLISKWDFSRRGLEERSEARNDLTLHLDDVENHVESGISLKAALRWVNQVIPSGRSKSIAKTATDAGLPDLTWCTGGFTSSPKPLEVIAAEIGWKRSKGEQARFIDIPVPPVSKAGIFDRLKGTKAQRVEEGKRWIARAERGTAQNFCVILPEFAEYLLEADRTKRLLELTERFVAKVAPGGDGWDQRFARKFGKEYAAGRLAVEAGLLHWPKNWPMKAVGRCYRRALRGIRSDGESAKKIVAMLSENVHDSNRFEVVAPGRRRPVRFGRDTLGVLTQYRGDDVCAMRDETLRQLSRSTGVVKEVVRQLNGCNLLKGGHGRRRTTQLPLKIWVDGKSITKPRFLLIDADGLARLARATSKPAGHHASGGR